MTDSPARATPRPARILVRGVNWLGDAVMTTPALQRLRQRFPEAHITLLTHEKLADLWQHHPSVDNILTFTSRQRPWAVARQLRERHFELALVLPNSPRSAFEVWLARIPERLGYARPWRNWLLTRPIPSRSGHVRMHKLSTGEIKELVRSPAGGTRRTAAAAASAHQVHEYLHLVGTLGADAKPLPTLLAATPGEVEAAASKFGIAHPSSGTPVFGLNPGAEYGPAKRWPAEQFIAAARAIQQRAHCTWLILGGHSDLAVADAICTALQNAAPASGGAACLNLAGRTSLRELMGLLKLCRVLLTNDTGPMHVAAALGTPVVVPFGSTSPELTGPGLPGDSRHRLLKSDAPCSPCFRRACPIDLRCMTGITAERVADAVLQIAR